MIDTHKVKRMSQGVKDVTIHLSHSALTVRLVPGCVGVYPWLQLPGALATQNLAEGVRCFQRGFHKVFCRISSPPVSHTLLFLLFLVHGGCPPASITQKRPNHGQVSVHGEPKFIEGQQPYVQ